jgi:flagellar FliL protein
MVETAAANTPLAPRRRGTGLLAGLLAALVLGAGGFAAAYLGLVPLPIGGTAAPVPAGPAPVGDVAFVALGPLTVSLGPAARARQLVLAAELEVAAADAAEVARVVPRIRDAMNLYLRAVEVRDLEAPAAMAVIRADLLRRIALVAGEGRVRDLLITEFVLN